MGSTTLEALLDRIVLQSDPKVVDLTSERKIATEVPGSCSQHVQLRTCCEAQKQQPCPAKARTAAAHGHLHAAGVPKPPTGMQH